MLLQNAGEVLHVTQVKIGVQFAHSYQHLLFRNQVCLVLSKSLEHVFNVLTSQSTLETINQLLLLWLKSLHQGLTHLGLNVNSSFNRLSHWGKVLVVRKGLLSHRSSSTYSHSWNLHLSELIHDFQEVIVVDYIVKARSEEVHELDELTRLNAPDVLKDDIDKVFLLDYASVVGVMHSELLIQVQLHCVVHLVNFFENESGFRILNYYFFFKQTSCLGSERVLLVPLERWLSKPMSLVGKGLLRRFFLSVVLHLVWTRLAIGSRSLRRELLDCTV